MSPQEIANALEERKNGQFVTVFISRPVKTRAGVSVSIQKESRVQVQLASYANRQPVKEAIANGTRDVPTLPKHISHVSMHGNVRFWIGFNGQWYFPYPVIGNASQVRYLVNGHETDAGQIKHLCLASEFTTRPSKETLAERGQVPFIGVKVENVRAIR